MQNCGGDSNAGQRGDGTTTDRTTRELVSGINAIAVSRKATT